MKIIKKKRLLFVMPHLLGGGAELILIRLISYLDRDKYEIGLFLFRNETKDNFSALIPSDVTIESVFDRDKARLRARYEFSWIFLRLINTALKYDILIGALELYPTFLSYFAGRLLRKRIVGWVHIAIEPYLKYCNFDLSNKLSRFVYPRLDAVVFVSKGAFSSMKSFLGNKESRNGMTIYNLLDYPEHYSENACIASKDDGKVVVAAGRLVPQKGFDILIKAHAKLIARDVSHNLVILGEGPLRAELEELAKNLGVCGSVVFKGFVSNPSEYFRTASVFVLSSRFEGLGMVILEAMMVGAPVIATDCPYGPAEILENGKYGILVPPEDVDLLSEAIEKMLFDPVLKNHLRQIGPLRAADFLPDKIISQWDRLFESL